MVWFNQSGVGERKKKRRRSGSRLPDPFSAHNDLLLGGHKLRISPCTRWQADGTVWMRSACIYRAASLNHAGWQQIIHGSFSRPFYRSIFSGFIRSFMQDRAAAVFVRFFTARLHRAEQRTNTNQLEKGLVVPDFVFFLLPSERHIHRYISKN